MIEIRTNSRLSIDLEIQTWTKDFKALEMLKVGITDGDDPKDCPTFACHIVLTDYLNEREASIMLTRADTQRLSEFLDLLLRFDSRPDGPI